MNSGRKQNVPKSDTTNPPTVPAASGNQNASLATEHTACWVDAAVIGRKKKLLPGEVSPDTSCKRRKKRYPPPGRIYNTGLQF